MGELFKIIGITLCVFLVDILYFALLARIKLWDIEDDDAFLFPAIQNGLGLSICIALLIYRIL